MIEGEKKDSLTQITYPNGRKIIQYIYKNKPNEDHDAKSHGTHVAAIISGSAIAKEDDNMGIAPMSKLTLVEYKIASDSYGALYHKKGMCFCRMIGD